jgi:hypothetical protein
MTNNKPFFTLLWVITLTIAGVFVLVGISLVPHFYQIGLAATIMLYIFMGYGTIAGGGFLAYKLYQWWNYRNLITHGDVVAYRVGSKEFEHLSAKHEQAKVIPQVTVSEQEHEPLPSEAWVVIDMHRQGIGFKKIAEATLWTEYEVRKLCNRLDGKTH